VLADAGLEVTEIADITGVPAILDHRVVTLHPRVHGGILADMANDAHLAEMRAHGIDAIDLVVVNLYPFSSKPSVEMIDIGGPAMVRAAAKNHARVGVVVDQADYDTVLDLLRHDDFGADARRQFAQKAFRITSAYDAAVASWLGADDARSGLDATLPHQLTLVAERDEVLRYGENPHQIGARYRLPGVQSWWDSALQLNGKEMSYLNVLDTEAAWQLVNSFDAPAVVIVKHANPCGVAVGSSIHDAYADALAADSVSAFGGIVAANRELDVDTAIQISKIFTEVVVAPGFSGDALDILCTKDSLRVLEATLPRHDAVIDVRSIDGGLLVQSRDNVSESRDSFDVVSKRQPTESEWIDLTLAWKVVAHTGSNAIVLARDGVTTGIGGGQPNRVDAARIALTRAGERSRGSVAASDAFFPFRDSVDELARAGVTAIIQPGGSVRDEESIAAANEHGIAMVFTGIRHFRH
jgi:phosphoribosylaminoimidazolecarboxamide formyltransferase/IMP cyclohydrolase